MGKKGVGVFEAVIECYSLVGLFANVDFPRLSGSFCSRCDVHCVTKQTISVGD